jgi:glycosyltransferase involved in cell wall biosynthesis
MRIAYLVPGNGAAFYCENCVRDAAQVRALGAAGHEVLAVPLYLPLEFRDARAASPVFFGAVSFFLQEAMPALGRLPGWARRLTDSRAALRLAAGLAHSTSARGREALTLSMLSGTDAVFRRENGRVADWLSTNFTPDVIHLSNLLLIGMARDLKKRFRRPVFITLQDEHTWLDSLSEPARAAAWETVRNRAEAVDAFLPVSNYYRRFMMQRLGVPASLLRTVRPGVEIRDPSPRPLPPRRAIGFLSRWSEPMGLGLLAEAFCLLKADPRYKDVQLLLCGGGTGEDRRFLKTLRARFQRAGVFRDVAFLPGFSVRERRHFFDSIWALSVPSRGGEAFGTFVVEAMAAGVPVVQPDAGGYTELVDGAGILVPPGDAPRLAGALSRLLDSPRLTTGLGQRGHDTARSSLSFSCYARSLTDAYRHWGGCS